ncbi:MAG: hypothetical protein WBP64_18130 [Nitrososphaeraceae archaeon]
MTETPNVNGLLTDDERQKSKRDSVDGKEHPINYIYNHPGFWNEQRIEQEEGRFKNVATLLGRTHLREPDGHPLYLNALDIDSEHASLKFRSYYTLHYPLIQNFLPRTRLRKLYLLFLTSSNKDIVSNDIKCLINFGLNYVNLHGLAWLY